MSPLIIRSFDSYLAGGAAILIEPNTARFSRDLDYFHDSETRVSEAFAADRGLLDSAGYSIDIDLNQSGFVRGIVRRGGDATKVEVALQDVPAGGHQRPNRAQPPPVGDPILKTTSLLPHPGLPAPTSIGSE